MLAAAVCGVYRGETPIYIHAKAIAFDAATPAGRVFIGIENLTVASLVYNREAGIVIADRAKVAARHDTMGRDFVGATHCQP